MADLIDRQAAIALADNLRDDLPDDERIADAVVAHNEGISEYQTALSLLPSAQPEQKTGRWIYSVDDDGESYICSQCMTEFEMVGGDADRDFSKWAKYCPVCGSCNGAKTEGTR